MSKFEVNMEEIKTCWALSKMIVQDLEKNLERNIYMVFVEF